MATVIDELVTVLGFDIKAGALPAIQKVNSMVSGITRYAGWASAALMSAAGSVGFFAERSARAAAELHKFSQLSGISSNEVQAWMYAVERAGGSADALKSDLMGLAKSMSSPIPGEYNQALFMLGVNVRKAGGELKTADEILMDIAGKFERMGKQTQLQWASRLGISDDTLLLLQMGRGEIEKMRKEAAAIPTIVSPEQLANAREFVTQLSLLRRIIEYLRQEIASSAGPAMKKLVDGFTEFIRQNRELIQLGLTNLVNGIVAGFDRFGGMIRSVAGYFGELLPWLHKFVEGMMGADIIGAVVFSTLTVLAAIIVALAAKWALVIAAVAAAALVFEDLMVYLRGGNSLIGDMVEWVNTLWSSFAKKFPGIAGFVEALGKKMLWLAGVIKDRIVSHFRLLWEVLSKVAGVLGPILSGMISLADKALLALGFMAGEKEGVEVPGMGKRLNEKLWDEPPAEGFDTRSGKPTPFVERIPLERTRAAAQPTHRPQTVAPTSNQTVTHNSEQTNHFHIQSTDPSGVAREVKMHLNRTTPGAFAPVAQ